MRLAWHHKYSMGGELAQRYAFLQASQHTCQLNCRTLTQNSPLAGKRACCPHRCTVNFASSVGLTILQMWNCSWEPAGYLWPTKTLMVSS